MLALGFFSDVQIRLERGGARGRVVLVVERGTVVLDRVFLGASEAVTTWGFEGRVNLERRSGVRIAADRLLLRRALVNLVENALQAGASRVVITVEPRGDRAAVVVADDGPGVPREMADRALDPCATTKEHGTGLGLAIVKKIVLEHGGAIALDERPGGGARFTITLPVAT